MNFSKSYYFTDNRLLEYQFDRALLVSRNQQNTQDIARAYLVERLPLSQIASRYGVTRQNIFRCAHVFLDSASKALTKIDAVVKVYKKLELDPGIEILARRVFFTRDTFDQIAKDLKANRKDVFEAAKAVMTRHGYFLRAATIKQKEEEFEQWLQFVRTKEFGTTLAYEYFVLDERLVDIARKYEVKTQNVYNVVKRFKLAREKYESIKAEAPAEQAET